MTLNEVKRKSVRLDPGILVVLIICGLAIWPFISRSSLPQATDAELHIFRVAELGRLVRSGEFYPRLAPNFYYGYGYPIFNYYAPLSYYVALVPELLPMWDAVDGVKIVFVLGILLGGLGAYGYAHRNWGRMPALVASAAYVYAPFVLFVDPHARGDLAEAFSFGVFPLALWAMDGLRRRPRARHWLLSVGLVALVVLSHNLMALVFCIIIAGWCLWQLIFSKMSPAYSIQGRASRRLLQMRLFLALFLGIGAAAFFWLTVALEQDAVNLASLIGDGGNFDYRNHFLSMGELIAPPAIMDWSATQPEFILGFGSIQWLLAATGLGALLSGRAQRKEQATFFVVVTGVLILLMLPVSRFIWDLVPFLPFLQFPWRLLGPVAFTMAILGAVGMAALMTYLPNPMARWLPALCIGLIILGALPLSQVPPWPTEFGPTTALRVVEEELAGRWLGTTSTLDFVPVTVDTVPGPTKTLLQDFRAERTLDRVNRATLPEGTSVKSAEITPLRFRYEVEGEVDFLLRLFLFDFPGWQVTVDGETVESELGRPEGFIVIPVSAGRHAVEVSFENTVARKLSFGASILSVVLALAYAVWLRSKRAMLQTYKEESLPKSVQGGWVEMASVSFVAILLLVANALLVEPNGWLRFDSPRLTALPAENDYYAELDGQVAFIGYDAPVVASPGTSLPFTAYWQALRPLEDNYQVFVHLVDSEGVVVAQSDALNPGAFPTRQWPLDKYVRDEHELALPDDLPEGDYRWSIGLWLASDGRRLPVTDGGGNTAGDTIMLPTGLQVG